MGDSLKHIFYANADACNYALFACKRRLSEISKQHTDKELLHRWKYVDHKKKSEKKRPRESGVKTIHRLISVFAAPAICEVGSNSSSGRNESTLVCLTTGQQTVRGWHVRLDGNATAGVTEFKSQVIKGLVVSSPVEGLSAGGHNKQYFLWACKYAFNRMRPQRAQRVIWLYTWPGGKKIKQNK